METALDFLSTAAVASEIRSLQLSLQIDVKYLWSTPEREAPPELPWHGRHSAWLQLRDRLPELENLRQLSIWLDAAGQIEREDLLYRKDTFELDARLAPFLRVSIPAIPPEQRGDHPWWQERDTFPSHPYVVGRGFSEFWQEPSVVPDIMWYPEYRRPTLYTTADEHIRRKEVSCIPPRPFPHIRALRAGESASDLYRVWKGKRKVSEDRGMMF